jgi:hypothetical protein
MMCKPVVVEETSKESSGGEIEIKGVDAAFWARVKVFLRGEFTTTGEYEKVCMI